MAVLAHTKCGDGDAHRILLHGFLGSGRNLSSLGRRWCEADPGVCLWLFDLTGHGHSRPLPEQPALIDLARDVLETARSIGIKDPLHVVGHSLGGRVALRARLLAPERIERVTLLDISPGPTVGRSGLAAVLEAFLKAPDHAPSRDEMGDALRAAGLDEPMVQWLLLNSEPTAGGVRWRVDRERLRRLNENGGKEELWDAINERTHCIRGGASSFVSDSDVQRMTRAGAIVDTIAGAGHFIHVEGLPQLVALLTTP